ncbi:MAG: glycosyltransferase family 39 protein [Nitrospira sp.]|nr:glycosyltransferase family 39 protein [Nitrospira sp.]
MLSDRLQKKLIACIFVSSLLVKLLLLAIIPAPALDDSARIYLTAAHLLMDGKGFSDPSFPVYNPPLYPIFIATCLSVFGDDQVSVKMVQIFVDSLTMVLIYLVMKEIFDVETALVSAGIFSLYPFTTYLTISIASDPFFTFLLTGFVLCSVYAVRSTNWWYYCVTGVLLGLATLTRSTTQFAPLMLPVMLILLGKRGRDSIFCYAALCLSFALVILPWTVRNYVVLGDFIPVGTSGGIVLLMGSSEKFLTIDGKPAMLQQYVPPVGGKPSQNDKFYTRAGLEIHRAHLQTDPLDFMTFMVKKFGRMWYATESGKNHSLILLSQLPIYVLAVIGIVFAWMKGKTFALIPLCLIAYFIGLHWLSLPLFRYMIPIMPYIIGLAAFAIVTVKNEWLCSEKTVGVFNKHAPN